MARYDETPMRVTHKQPMETTMPRLLDMSASSSSLPVGSLPHTGLKTDLVTKASSVSKMFSSEHTFAMVFRVDVPDMDNEVQTQMLTLFGPSLSWNQLLGGNTSDCMMRALQETCSVTSSASAFKMKVRIAVTDQHPANVLCEQLLTASRRDQWKSLHVFCTMHQAARCMSKSFILLEEHVSGLVNYALSLSIGANMVGFRAAVAAVLRNRPLLIHRGSPPAQVLQHKACMLELFGSTGTRQKERRLLLQHLATGDWNRKDVLEMYIAEGIDLDQNLLVQNYIHSLVYALCNKSFSTYPRHRWMGCDGATDEVCLLECVHGLATAAYEHWCFCLQSGRNPAEVVPKACASSTCVEAVPGVALDVALEDVEPSSGSDGGNEDDGTAGIGSGGVSLPLSSATAQASSSLAAKNDKRRKK
eukprot:4751857-Amphidinium_carterae.1